MKRIQGPNPRHKSRGKVRPLWQLYPALRRCQTSIQTSLLTVTPVTVTAKNIYLWQKCNKTGQIHKTCIKLLEVYCQPIPDLSRVHLLCFHLGIGQWQRLGLTSPECILSGIWEVIYHATHTGVRERALHQRNWRPNAPNDLVFPVLPDSSSHTEKWNDCLWLGELYYEGHNF